MDVLNRWESVLERLGDDPMKCSRELDWVAKLRLLQGYRDRDRLGWGSSRLQLVDLQYADVRPDKGLYNRLVARDAVERLVTEEQVLARPPPTRRRRPGHISGVAACVSSAPRWWPQAGIR